MPVPPNPERNLAVLIIVAVLLAWLAFGVVMALVSSVTGV
jgi:hypothetical protein